MITTRERWLLYGGLPLLVALSALFKVRDLDVWWRVKTGEWIWQHGAIPDTDPFSHTAAGPWNCVEPAGNLFLYAFHAAFGPGGLSWAGAVMALAMAVAVVALAQYVIEEGPTIGPVFVAVGLFVAVSNYRFGPKPELFTLCGLAVLLLVLHATERTRNWKLLLSIPLIVLCWAWLHRGSTVSIPVIGAAAVVWAVRRDTRRLAMVAGGALLLTFGALLITPGMAGALSSSASVVSNPAYANYIGEWRPLGLGDVWSTMPLLPLLVVLWILVAPVQRRLHFGTLVVLGLGLMGLKHSRFVPLWALAMVPEVTWGLARVLHYHKDTIARQVRPAVLTAVLVAGATAAIGWSYLGRPPATWGPGVHHTLRPVGAARFLAQFPPPGKMFNTFNYGSYLLYALGPEQKVFIDGRNDQVYSPELFAQSAVTPGNAQALANLIETYEVTYAVLQCTKMVNYSYQLLYQNPQWQLVFLDDKAAVLVKRTAESEAYLDTHGYHELSPSTAIARAHAPQEDPRHRQFAEEVLRNVAESPDSIRAHYLAALVHQAAGCQDRYLEEREQVRALAADRRLTVALP